VLVVVGVHMTCVCAQLLDAQEVIDGTVDERGLVLYVSLCVWRCCVYGCVDARARVCVCVCRYFHAFMALSERDKVIVLW
jgi:hypothetical protein